MHRSQWAFQAEAGKGDRSGLHGGERQHDLTRGRTLEAATLHWNIVGEHRRFRSVMSCCSPRNAIVAQVERTPIAAHCERLPIGREYRSVVTHQLHSGVTLRDLIERKGEGL
jgi:hypothetical protein